MSKPETPNPSGADLEARANQYDRLLRIDDLNTLSGTVVALGGFALTCVESSSLLIASAITAGAGLIASARALRSWHEHAVEANKIHRTLNPNAPAPYTLLPARH